MIKNISILAVSLIIALPFVIGDASAGTFDVEPGNDIQSIIDSASDGDTINFVAGTYSVSSTLNLNKPLTMIGTEGTVLDVSGVSGYGVSWTGNDITMKNFEIKSGSSPVTFTLKISGANNITLENVSVDASQKTAVDLNGVTVGILTNVNATNTVAGFGINMVDSDNLTLIDITTSGNAWGGVSIQTEGYHHDGGADNISFKGKFDVVEGNLLLEQDPCRASGGPAGCTAGQYVDITNIELPLKYAFAAFTIRDGSEYKQTFYVETLDNARTLATSLKNHASLTHKEIIIHDVPVPGAVLGSVENKPIDNLHVMPILEITDAINAAGIGDTINLDAGSHTLGGVTLDKNLRFVGADDTTNTLLTLTGTVNILTGDPSDTDRFTIKDMRITGDPSNAFFVKGPDFYLFDNLALTNMGGTPFDLGQC